MDKLKPTSKQTLSIWFDKPRENYVHQPLDLGAKTIHLLKLNYQPLDGSPIFCPPRLCIKPLDLDDERSIIRKYKALSYEWGQPDEDGKFVIIDGKYLTIRYNLWWFLTIMQTDETFCVNNYLWIDAISIDQTNIKERNHQVAQMAEVYHSADEVLVWIRPRDPTEALFGFNTSVAPNAFQKQHFPHIGEASYWSRLWIIQEIILARSLTVLCGRAKLSWDEFIPLCERSDQHIINLSRARRIRSLANGGEGLDWADAYEMVKGAKCEDPRDKIYGLLGLVTQSRLVGPDYGKPLQAIVDEVVEKEAMLRNLSPKARKTLRYKWESEVGLSKYFPSDDTFFN